MAYKIFSGKFSMTNRDDVFYKQKIITKGGFREKIYLNLEIIGGGVYAESLTQKIIAAVEDMFFSEEENIGYNRFEETLKGINEIYGALLKRHKDKSLGKINAILAVIEDNGNIHLTQSGNAEAYLIRRSKMSVITEGFSSDNQENDVFNNIASGQILENDKVVFSTGRLLRFATSTQLISIFGEGVTEALDIVKNLATTNDTENLGVIALNIKKDIPIYSKPSDEINVPKKTLKGLKNRLNSFISMVSRLTGSNFEDTSRNTILLTLLVIIIILILGVTSLVSKNIKTEEYAKQKKELEQIEEDLHTAETRALMEDLESANAILEKAEKKVNEIINSGYFREEALLIMEKISEQRDEANNIHHVKNPKVLVDLSYKNPSIEARYLVSLKDRLFVLGYNTLYETILDIVEEAQIVDENEIIISANVLDEKNIMVMLTQSNKIIEYQNKKFGFADTEDTAWHNAVGLSAFNKYIYLLSPKDNQIYKYERRKNKYTSAISYNTDADLKSAVSFAIDGNIYILIEGGEIVKLYRGEQVDFKIDNLPEGALSNATKIFTLVDQRNLYILDPVENKIIVINKDFKGTATYHRQYIIEGVSQIMDFYVDKAEQKLWVMDSSKIYEINL